MCRAFDPIASPSSALGLCGSASDSAGSCIACPAGKAMTSATETMDDSCYWANNNKCDCDDAKTDKTDCYGSAIFYFPECSSCPLGKFSTEGSSTCEYCPLGSVGTADGTDCVECEAGKYSGYQAMDDSCTWWANNGQCDCPDPKTDRTDCYGSEELPMEACADCPSGTFGACPGATACQDCPLGTVSTGLGTTSCTACADGTVRGLEEVRKTGWSEADCAAQGLQLGDGAYGGQTNYCGWTELEAMDSCEACASGKAPSADQAACCYDPPLVDDSCYWANDGQCNCPDKTTDKTDCEKAHEIASCSLTEAPASPPPSCDPSATCEAGQYANFQGCRYCVPGKYKAVNGSEACTDCGPGTYSAAPGATVCSSCPEGLSSQAGRTAPSDCICNAGFTGPDGGPCVMCEAGKYKGTAGSDDCADCGAGKYSAAVGAEAESACTVCVAGKYSEAAGAIDDSTCIECPDGGSSPAGSSSPARCGGFSHYVLNPGPKEIPEGATYYTSNPHDYDGRVPGHWRWTRPGKPLKVLVQPMDFAEMNRDPIPSHAPYSSSLNNTLISTRLMFRDMSWGKVDWEFTYLPMADMSTPAASATASDLREESIAAAEQAGYQ